MNGRTSVLPVDIYIYSMWFSSEAQGEGIWCADPKLYDIVGLFGVDNDLSATTFSKANVGCL